MLNRSMRFCCLVLLITSILMLSIGSDTRNELYAEGSEAANTETDDFVSFRKDGYDFYLREHEQQPRPQQQIIIPADSYSHAEGMTVEKLHDYEGAAAPSILTGETGSVSWDIDVPQEGMYNIGLSYFPVAGKSSAIERELLIDGQSPFEGARTLTFSRVWVNTKSEIERDNRGNDLRPGQMEKPMWMDVTLKDHQGYYNEPYLFYFSAGRHTLTLVSSREPMVIGDLMLFQEEEIPSYDDVLKAYEQAGYRKAEQQLIKIQGQDALRKSDPTLYPINNRSSPSVEPYDVSKIRMNTIGGFNWRMPSQWIAWEVDAPEDGLYEIHLKVKQNMLRGLYASRKLYIDGKVPFREVESVTFDYDNLFQMKSLGDADPYLFYLTKGKHEIKLEVTLGTLAPLLRQVESSVLELNTIYRKILMVTGAVPDRFRDYNLDKQIPDMIEVFERQSEQLFDVVNTLKLLTGESSDRVAILNTMAHQLDGMAQNPESIPRRLEMFKVNVGGLGTWILQAREQPLEIDYLLVTSPGHKLPKAEASFLGRMFHEVSAFFHSFKEDYNSIGDVVDGKQAVEIWIGTGRDQAQVLKAMIDDTFTPQTGIQVNLKLVNMGVLLPATLSGQGPDVAMQIGNDVPVNYASRKAVQDLTIFPDYEEVASRFKPSALVPYAFEEGVYALPEQQLFSMLFFRKDILEELGLSVPQTWDDVYAMIPVLQKHHLEFALPLAQPVQGQIAMNLEPNATLAMLLYQMDGEFYSPNHQYSGLNSEVSMQAFKKWTEFYTNYKFPVQFDFPNRFRTGEMPIGVADYTFYNHLSVSAPEIKGLWDFAPIPGTEQADGTIRRDVASGGTNVIMLQGSEQKEAAWAFMKWWTDKDAQVRFGREMEGLMGAAARYPTANVEALEQLPWPVKDYLSLSEQWKSVRAIPEVPGGYFTGRHLDNAFREVITNGMNPREALFDYVRYINEEITLKRREFGLPAEGEEVAR
ncbi:extracellular solute-binding protein [Paenibacillus paeoniae]|uniref:Extracellular solute-binding protein n=2 Tax=Paenibacillus paeoniae TaxID=2292705 RepID=A0A371PI80_9BACL|nr:extracellular solute-binding protein [Paenibacillus paeoniae]